MKCNGKSTKLPVLAAAAGTLALVLRRVLYAVAVDAKNLLVRGHGLTWLLLGLSAAVLGFVWLQVRQLEGSEAYEDNFSASKTAGAGCLAGGIGMALTVLTAETRMPGYLGAGWQLFGLLSPLCLGAAAWCRVQGRKPFFALYLLPSLFLMLHVINQYQSWSGNPQFQDYGFALLGCMGLMLFAFYSAAFTEGLGNRRMQLGTGLSAVYLLGAELGCSLSPWLSLGGLLWALTDLCSLTPVPKPEQPEKKEI